MYYLNNAAQKKTNKNNKKKTRIEKQINKLEFCNIAQ